MWVAVVGWEEAALSFFNARWWQRVSAEVDASPYLSKRYCCCTW